MADLKKFLDKAKRLLKQEFPQLDFHGILLDVEPEKDKAGKHTGKVKVNVMSREAGVEMILVSR